MEACWAYGRLRGRRRRIRKRAIFWNPWRSRRIYCCIRKKRGKISRRFLAGCGGLSRRCRWSDCGCGRKEKRILRRGLKRFWLLVSVVAVVALATQAGLRAGGPKPVNELTLAGLRPGKDSLEKASKKFGEESKIKASDDSNSHSWQVNCFLNDLLVEGGPNGIIRNVTVSVSHA